MSGHVSLAFVYPVAGLNAAFLVESPSKGTGVTYGATPAATAVNVHS